MGLLKAFIFLVIAAIIGSLVGTIISTAHVLSGLSDMGVALTSDVIFSSLTRDLAGLVPVMAGLFLPGFIIAFIAASLLAKLVPSQKRLIYSVAGGVSVFTTFYLIQSLLGVSPISAARDPLWMIAASGSGVISGFIFISLAMDNKATS